MSDAFDQRARESAGRLRGSVAGVQPRRRTTMPSAKPKVAAAAVAALLAAAIGVAVTVGSSSTSKPSNLLPADVTTNPGDSSLFAPAGLGVSLMLPSTWKAVPPAENAQYGMEGPTVPRQFLVAGRYSGVVPVVLSRLVGGRIRFLQGKGAQITSSRTGVVDGYPAARITYLISGSTTVVADTEYDIITASPLAAGANQHQTVYSDIEIVLGTAQSNAARDKPLFDWIASTIRVP